MFHRMHGQLTDSPDMFVGLIPQFQGLRQAHNHGIVQLTTHRSSVRVSVSQSIVSWQMLFSRQSAPGARRDLGPGIL